jgi:hypothetical protein
MVEKYSKKVSFAYSILLTTAPYQNDIRDEMQCCVFHDSSDNLIIFCASENPKITIYSWWTLLGRQAHFGIDTHRFGDLVCFRRQE